MSKALVKPVLLIDGDILCYRAASATDGRLYEVKYKMETKAAGATTITVMERFKKDADKVREKAGENFISLEQTWDPEPRQNAFKIMEDMLISLERNLEKHIGGPVGEKKIFLSRGGSFREKECPTYKSNREDMRRPANLEFCKDYLMKKYGASCDVGQYEADDLLAMNAGDNTIICSVDKDLLQVPGSHYNFVKDIFMEIDELTGWYNFYSQLLTGDTSDGIVGIHGVGPARAKKILTGLQTPFLMYCAVLREYLLKTPREEGEPDDEFYGRVSEIVHKNAHLLYLLRKPGERWEEPVWA